MQAMKDIRSQYGDSVIVEFSGDGLAALAEDRRDSMSPEDREAMEARNAAFQKDIVQIDKSLNNLPAYSGMYGADKAVASALDIYIQLIMTDSTCFSPFKAIFPYYVLPFELQLF